VYMVSSRARCVSGKVMAGTGVLKSMYSFRQSDRENCYSQEHVLFQKVDEWNWCPQDHVLFQAK